MLLSASKLCLLLSVATVSLFSLASGTHHQSLHCKKWKQSCENLNQTSCCDIRQRDDFDPAKYPSRIYPLKSGEFSSSTNAWCDMETDNGGWTVIMRRVPDDNFYEQVYNEYENGFGDLSGGFWYGLRSMNRLTSNNDYEMRLDLFDDANDTESSAHATYNTFKVGRKNYTLTIGGFKGSDPSIPDNLHQFNGQTFVTLEHKQDIDESKNCAIRQQSGWWYVPIRCTSVVEQPAGTVLTLPYNKLNYYDAKTGRRRVYAKYEMKIRPLNCRVESST